MSKLKKLTFLIILFCGLVACKESIQVPQGSDTLYDLPIADKVLKAKIMITDSEKARGLMFLKSIPENFGMVFVYNSPQKASFWMKNTEIPLDLAFFDKEGILTEVKPLYPHNLNSVQSSRSDIYYCIETNSGWFEKNNIQAGAKLDLNTLKKAIKLRKGEK